MQTSFIIKINTVKAKTYSKHPDKGLIHQRNYPKSELFYSTLSKTRDNKL